MVRGMYLWRRERGGGEWGGGGGKGEGEMERGKDGLEREFNA